MFCDLEGGGNQNFAVFCFMLASYIFRIAVDLYFSIQTVIHDNAQFLYSFFPELFRALALHIARCVPVVWTGLISVKMRTGAAIGAWALASRYYF